MQISQEETPFPTQYEYCPQLNEQLIVEQVLRLSLEYEHRRVYSPANGLSKHLQKLIKSMKMGRSTQKCSICIEGFVVDQLIKKLPCGHILHKQCAKSYFKLNNRCPICRLDLHNHLEPIYQTSTHTEKKAS